jgi:uncharacterized protein YecE (DUF72 family)
VTQFDAVTKQIRIGTAGWTIPSQHAAEAAGEGTHLQRYARIFNCVEINSSFYRPHRIATWQRWAGSVPPDFRFSVKMPRAITHDAALAPTLELLPKFLAEISGLGAKLGPILVQLPPKLALDAARAAQFFTIFRDLYHGPVALEPRNPSWFSPVGDDLLQRFHLSRVAADPPRTAHDSKPAGWPALQYYRLHGSPRIYYSAYSDAFLAALTQQIAQGSSTESWTIFDNTALGEAFANAQTLQQRFAQL